MISFLSRAGQILKTGLKWATGISAIVDFGKAAGTVSHVIGFLEKGAEIILNVEAGVARLRDNGDTVTGAQKLELAYPAFAKAILTSDLLAGNHIKNDALFEASAKKMLDGLVGVLNSLDEDDAGTKEPKNNS